jgi:hypothetical protein
LDHARRQLHLLAHSHVLRSVESHLRVAGGVGAGE